MSDHFTYPPAGYCIYCGARDCDLSDEHIIPYALNGNLVLPKASCAACAKFTQKIEEVCTHKRWEMLAPFRSKNKMQSRSRWTRENKVSAEVIRQDGTRGRREFAADSFPAMLFGIHLPVAGILQGVLPTNEVECKFQIRIFGDVDAGAFKGEAVRACAIRYEAFFQLLAKIGYAYTAAEIGGAPYPMVADIILGRSDKTAHLIGGNGLDHKYERADFGHRLELRDVTVRDAIFTVAVIRLFGDFGMPEYHVVMRQGVANQ